MFDYLIIGAGPSGLCAAKTILECEPDAQVRLLDANKSVGGVWARENLYPGLKTNNLRGTIDFSDFPMHDGFSVREGEHCSGEAMHEYLSAYAERSDVLRRVDFETTVTEAARLDGTRGWKLTVCRAPGQESEMLTRNLIVATGVTNRPHRPRLRGSENFGGPLIHSAELGLKGTTVIESPAIKTIAVLGGGKSAYDAVHLAGRTGHQVEWIMRKSGKGPEWVFPAHAQIGPFSAQRERLAGRRIVSFFSPCLWKDGFGLVRGFLHFTALGKLIAQKFWANLHAATLAECGMLRHEKTKVLEPETSPFWYGTASGIYNFERDIYEMVRSGQVRIHREDISHLSSGTIHFASGGSIEADALITATGFSAKPTLTFTPASIHSELGIPTTSLSKSQQEFWGDLDAKADHTIARSFPRLIAGPFLSPSSNIVKPYHKDVDPELDYTPFRLFRGIAPPGPTTQGDHSLVFISMFSNLANIPRTELQSLWAYAYLNHKLAIDHPTVFDETALMNRYVKHRAPYGHGRFFPDVVFDQIPYFDTLLQDLKLKYWRKGNIVAEVFQAYNGSDYNGIVQEWLRANGGGPGPLARTTNGTMPLLC